MSGCVPSLHPFYTDEDLAFDASLLGVWGEKDGTTWAFAKKGDRSYLLTHTEQEGATGRMDAHLFKVGKQLFLDTFPEDPGIEDDLQKAHLLGTHFVWKFSLAGDSLRLAALHPDKVKSMVEQKKLIIAHERIKDGLVFTASTPDLQAFLARYAEGADVFGDWEEMTRQK
jgi:hypothetical protein